MALTATMYRLDVTLSDVDRGVYESLELRLAMHPSESPRYLVTRTLAYCLSYEEGIAWSKGGISSTDEPPVAIHDPTGLLLASINVGAPSADRLHKAAKAARRVALFSTSDLGLLRKEAASRPIHKLESIEVHLFDGAFVESIFARLERNTALELVRNDGQIYVTCGGVQLSGTIVAATLAEPRG